MFSILDNSISLKNHVYNFKVYLHIGYFVDLPTSLLTYRNICSNIHVYKENMTSNNYINGYDS